VRDLWLGADVVMNDVDIEALICMMGEIVDGMVGEECKNAASGRDCMVKIVLGGMVAEV